MMNTVVYYLVMYVWRSTLDSAGHWNRGEWLTEMHPLQWLVKQRREHSRKKMPNKKLVKYEYALTGWKEVSQEIYELYKDEVG